MKRLHTKGKKSSDQKAQQSRTIDISWDLTALVRRILNLPRAVRILLTSLFGLAVTLAVFPIVDELYVRFLFDESTRLLPSFVSVAFGIIMYIWGWRLIIGTIGEEHPVRAIVFWYLVVGILAILLVIGLLLQGYSIATAPDL